MATPVAGVTYGGHGIWSWQSKEGLPRDHERTGLAQPWSGAKDLPASGQMKHLVDLLTSLPWTKLRPAQELLVSQPGAQDPARFVSACRIENGTSAVVYLPQGGRVEMHLKQLQPGIRARWFDPRTGRFLATSNSDASALLAPDEQDWLLVLGNN